MGKAVILACWLAGAGCGRAGFDAIGAGNAVGDGTGNDGMSGAGHPAISCSGLAPTCGPSGTSPCCANSLVPGGTFYRSYDVGTDGANTDMTGPASVSDFRLETYEVTVGRFRQFVNAGMGTQQNPPPMGAGARTLNGMANQGGWDAAWNGLLLANTPALAAALKCSALFQTWTDTPGTNESLPMNCISWYEAMAFCTWDGGFLPTEAEWNYAATGGSEQRAYPWSIPASSVTISCTYANEASINYTTLCVNSPTGAVNRVGSESPNGDGKWGQADLGGNVDEWVLDWYVIPYSTSCNDCANLLLASYRVARGGSFAEDPSRARGAWRGYNTAASHNFEFGVRCARNVP